MTRVNVDDVAFMDRRFKLLGGRLGITWQEALGRCLPVWALAYARRSAVLPAGDIDALAERQGFAAAMLEVDLAMEDEAGLYLRGVADRIDFLLIQDAKREKARQAKLDAHGVASPRRPSRGTARPRAADPAGPSPGTIPGRGPYSPDLDLDLTPDLDQEDPPPARAIPPSPEPAPTPAPAATPAPDREMDRFVHSAPHHAEPTLDQLWTELEQARARAAGSRGVAIQPLVAHDPGRHDLAEALAEAARVGRRAALVEQVRHAIAVAEAEARVTPEPGKRDQLQWFTGAIFAPRNFRRLVAAPAPAKRGSQPGGGARRPDPGPPAIVSTLTVEERLALAAESRATLGIADGARAPPASARSATDENEQPQPARTPA